VPAKRNNKDQNIIQRLWPQSKWKRVLTILAGIAFLGILALAFLVFLIRAEVLGPIPTYSDLASIQNNQASEVYDHQGVLLGKYYIENRINADSSELPGHLIQALVATEDARFFEHQGIDIRSLGRVLVKSILLSDESSGGGSTISQQLAKNLYPRQDYWMAAILVNKIREMLIARRLERTYPKDQVIRMYLNTVPFGGNIYGIKVGAQTFFNKGLDQLTVEEGAVLVGMLKATTYYNPVRYPDRAVERRNLVLRRLSMSGYLTETEAAELMEKEMVLDFRPEQHNTGLATYFREHLRLELIRILAELEGLDGARYNLYTDGLKIRTTIDANMQSLAERSLGSHLARLQQIFLREWQGREPWLNASLKENLIRNSARYLSMSANGIPDDEILKAFEVEVDMVIYDVENGEREVLMSPLDSIRYYLQLLRGGMLVAEPEGGQVRAWVGGTDHRFIQYDHVKSERQIGSLMKPIVFAAALQNGIHPCDYFENQLVKYEEYKGWEPRNSDDEYGGFYSMEGALAHSVNTIAVDIALQTGLNRIRKLANDLGIRQRIPEEPAIALGAVEASLWEMLKVYGTFSNLGVSPELHYLEEIRDASGQLIWEKSSQQEQRIIEQEDAILMTHLMQSVVDSGTARRLRYEFGFTTPIAGKTGTTQDQADGWFVGYTPELIAAVWVGGELPSIHFRTTANGQGANTALPVWGNFMRELRKENSTRTFLQGSFPAIKDSMAFELDCPPYIPDLPFDSVTDLAKVAEFARILGNVDPERLEEIMDEKPKRRSESLSEYSKRIRERNQRTLEKRERKKKRQAFFDKIFGKKKKER
jgi:penicillin-binding protein 1A